MNVDDMIRIYRDDGHDILLQILEQEFNTQDDLHGWAADFGRRGSMCYGSWYAMICNIVSDLDVKRVLDIGVHVGQFSILPRLISDRTSGDHIKCCSISPFDGTGDKYNFYGSRNYLDEYVKILKEYNIPLRDFTILRGRSDDDRITRYFDIKNILSHKFDLMFLDGSHDYENVVHDIQYYACNFLRDGGIVVVGDACYFDDPDLPDTHRCGHSDVVRAVKEHIEDSHIFEHLFDLTHLRIFRKKVWRDSNAVV